MIEVIKYGPKVQKEITCPKCESQLRFLNSDIKNINDVCPWDDTCGYLAEYIKCPACGEKVIIWERNY